MGAEGLTVGKERNEKKIEERCDIILNKIINEVY